MTLAELKTKYGLGDGAKYEPKKDCKFCKGVGERYKDGVGEFCICLYVDHSMSDFAGDGLSELAKKLKKEPPMPNLMNQIDEWELVLKLMSDEDIGDDDARVIELLEKIESDIRNKIDGYCGLMRKFKDYGAESVAEAERCYARADVWQRKHQSLKDRLKLAMERMGERQIVTAKNTVTICGNGGQQPLEITGHVPEEFQKTITKVVDDTDRIRTALASGELPFARLKERGSHLRVS